MLHQCDVIAVTKIPVITFDTANSTMPKSRMTMSTSLAVPGARTDYPTRPPSHVAVGGHSAAPTRCRWRRVRWGGARQARRLNPHQKAVAREFARPGVRRAERCSAAAEEGAAQPAGFRGAGPGAAAPRQAGHSHREQVGVGKPGRPRDEDCRGAQEAL